MSSKTVRIEPARCKNQKRGEQLLAAATILEPLEVPSVPATIERLLSQTPGKRVHECGSVENDVENLNPNNFWRSSRTVRCDRPVHLHTARQR
jgi:hypothetical protein